MKGELFNLRACKLACVGVLVVSSSVSVGRCRGKNLL